MCWLARHLACLALVALLPLTAAVAEEKKLRLPGIKGTDDRELVETTDYPWRAIGRLNKETGGFCTGVLVAASHVLTAAHCLWNRRTHSWTPPTSIHFLAGYQRGSFVAHARATDYIVAPDYSPWRPGTSSNRDPGHDWALVTLADALGAQLGTIEVMATEPAELARLLRDGGVPLNAGYAMDKAHILTRHMPCTELRFASAGRLLVHDCDATFGSSGSPILVRLGDSFRVAGIHVATARVKGVTIGIGVPAATFADRVPAP